MSANHYPKSLTFRRFALCGIPLSIAVAVAVYFALPRLQIPTDNPVFTAILLLIAPAAAALISGQFATAFRLRKTPAGFSVATLIACIAAFICTAVMTRTGYFNESDAKLALLWLALALGITNGTITAAIALPGVIDDDEDDEES